MDIYTACFKSKTFWGLERWFRLRALAVLTGDPGTILRICVVVHNCLFIAPFWLLLIPRTFMPVGTDLHLGKSPIYNIS